MVLERHKYKVKKDRGQECYTVTHQLVLFSGLKICQVRIAEDDSRLREKDLFKPANCPHRTECKRKI